MVVLTGIVMRGCLNVGCCDNCMGVLVTCVLASLLFCIVCTVFYCFLYVYLFLFVLSVLV